MTLSPSLAHDAAGPDDDDDDDDDEGADTGAGEDGGMYVALKLRFIYVGSAPLLGLPFCFVPSFSKKAPNE